jgi:hypothetical protein
MDDVIRHLLAGHAIDDQATIFGVAEATDGIGQFDLAGIHAQVVVLTFDFQPVALVLADQDICVASADEVTSGFPG